MSHHHHEHGHNAVMHPQETVEHEVAPTSKSLLIFAVLVGLAFLALFAGFSDIGPWKVAVSLAISAVQATVLAVFFMDLRQADRLTWLVAAAGLFWTFLLFLFTLTDYLTRHLGVI